MKWAGHVAQFERGMHIGHQWKSQKERDQLGRPRRKWVDNIKMGLREAEWSGMDSIDLIHDRDQ
jgi:hypothetical protein